MLKTWHEVAETASRQHRVVLRAVINMYRRIQALVFEYEPLHSSLLSSSACVSDRHLAYIMCTRSAWASLTRRLGDREKLLDGLFLLISTKKVLILRSRTLMWWRMWAEREESERKRLAIARRQLVRSMLLSCARAFLACGRMRC